jgi:hypothetical protein
MGTWVLNGTTVTLQDNNNSVGIGVATTTPQIKLEVVGNPARLKLQDKGGEVYDVRAFGAAGDGTTDDRAAIQSAINAAETADPAFGIVYFPPGKYLVGDSGGPDLLTFTKPVQFLGAGPFLSIITTNQGTKNIFHGTLTVTDLSDKVRPIIFRDLKFEASVTRTADAAIRQDVASGSTFEHGIRIENCHFKTQFIAIQLRAASTAVIANCMFWSGIASQADVWIDEQVGGDSTTHLITGCLFADTLHAADMAVKLTGGCGGDRIIGNLFVNYDTHIYVNSSGSSSMLIQGNVMEAPRTASVRLTGKDQQVHSVITGNAMRAAGNASTISRCILADVGAADAFVDQITVVGNKLAGDTSGLGTKGIELNPTGGAATDRWLIAENTLYRFSVALEIGTNVTGLMLGSNAYVGNTTNMSNNSSDSRGATFLDRVGIGAENTVTPIKEVHVKSTQATRPRIYLEGTAGTSSPGVEFAFDAVNTQRAAVVGTAVGAGVQLELFTKPDGAGAIAQRLVLDKDGNAIWTSANYQEMIEVAVGPSAPATDKARLFMRDNGAGKTQFCVRFATGAVQVLATQP